MHPYSPKAVPLVLIALLSLAACSTGESDSGVTPGRVHPVEENIPGPRNEAFVLTKNTDSTADTALHEIAGRLRRADSLRQIGSRGGSMESIIGQVEDVAAGPEGSVLVLDSKNMQLRFYDAEGTFLRSLGGPGEGPGELRGPEGIERDGRGRVVVADRFGKLAVFSDTAHVEDISIQFGVKHFCIADTAIFVSGRSKKDGVFHRLSLSGEVEQSMGQVYRAENAMVRNDLSNGPLICGPGVEHIVFAFQTASYLYGYSPAGEIDWMTRIDDYQPTKIEEYLTDDGRPGMRFSFGESHLISRLTRLPRGHVLLQVAWRTDQSMKQDRLYAQLDSYLVDIETGRGVYVGTGLPFIYDATETHLYGGRNYPYPQVVVFEY